MKAYPAPLLWALLILILCGMPGKDIPHISFLELLSFDKWVHAGIFFVLTLLLIRSFRLQQKREWLLRNAVYLAPALAGLYGGLTEILQATLFIDRDADLYDFIADGFGCILAALI